MNIRQKREKSRVCVDKTTVLYFFTAKPQLQTHAITVKKSESFGTGAFSEITDSINLIYLKEEVEILVETPILNFKDPLPLQKKKRLKKLHVLRSKTERERKKQLFHEKM